MILSSSASPNFFSFLKEFNIFINQNSEILPRELQQHFLSHPFSKTTLNTHIIQQITSSPTIPSKYLLQIANAINISQSGSVSKIKPNTTIKLILTDGHQACVAIILQQQQIRFKDCKDLLGKKIVVSKLNCSVKKSVLLIKKFEVMERFEDWGKEEEVEDEEEDADVRRYLEFKVLAENSLGENSI